MAIWDILCRFGIFYGGLGYFMTIWYILYSFGTFFRFWYHVPRKIWQAWLIRPEIFQLFKMALCLMAASSNFLLSEVRSGSETAFKI
jgi:hypothetical protein